MIPDNHHRDQSQHHGHPRDLVVYGKTATTDLLWPLITLTGAVRIALMHNGVVRLFNIDRIDGVAMFCKRHALEWATVDSARRLNDFKLLAMDMDSTLITIECIDEIAAAAGLKPQVAAITAAAMRGEIAYRESLTQRVALLAGISERVLADVYDERLALSPGAEMLMRAAKSAQLHTLLVSGGFTYYTERLKTRLGLDEAHSNTLEIVAGKLTGRLVGEIFDGAAKARAVQAAADRLGARRDQIMVIGDGANDLAMMAIAGTSIAYHAKPLVREQASFTLDTVGLDAVLGLFPPIP